MPLNWYDFEFRTYDPQLGRWWQADPLMQHASPYLAMSNNPVLFTDPLGLWDGAEDVLDPIKNLLREVVCYANRPTASPTSQFMSGGSFSALGKGIPI